MVQIEYFGVIIDKSSSYQSPYMVKWHTTTECKMAKFLQLKAYSFGCCSQCPVKDL